MGASAECRMLFGIIISDMHLILCTLGLGVHFFIELDFLTNQLSAYLIILPCFS